MKTKDIECPACKAGPGEKCHDVGVGDEARNKSGFHVSRARRAHYGTVGARLANNAAKKGIAKQ